MVGTSHYIGQRLSFKGQTCTVHYIGPVDGKQGVWMGVEWDETTRGKHNGTHEGRQYFTCRSRSPTAASFIRSSQTFDLSKSFLTALQEKYISPNLDLTAQQQDKIYFSSKQAEEVGFDKFAARQAHLHGIRTIVLDRMCVRHTEDNHRDEAEIQSLCLEITELDIGGNLFESYSEIRRLCRCFPKLQTLNLNGNRFVCSVATDTTDQAFTTVETLNVSNTLLQWNDEFVLVLQQQFPRLRTLTATHNELVACHISPKISSLRTIDISNNKFTALADVAPLAAGQIETLLLRKCEIAGFRDRQLRPTDSRTWVTLKELDIRDNALAEWKFFDELVQFASNLRHLRSSGNPVYTTTILPSGKIPTVDEAYMLTVARLPGLETLNYSKITDKDRMNSEIYYLNLVAAELSTLSKPAEQAEARSRHPRFSALCAEYGEPEILLSGRARARDASQQTFNTLASRLMKIHFTYADQNWTQDIPSSASVYEVLGLVGKRLQLKPLRLRLIFESHEANNFVPADYAEPDWWDSDGEENGEQRVVQVDRPMSVELTPGTRPLSTYFDSREARILVETRSD